MSGFDAAGRNFDATERLAATGRVGGAALGDRGVPVVPRGGCRSLCQQRGCACDGPECVFRIAGVDAIPTTRPMVGRSDGSASRRCDAPRQRIATSSLARRANGLRRAGRRSGETRAIAASDPQRPTRERSAADQAPAHDRQDGTATPQRDREPLCRASGPACDTGRGGARGGVGPDARRLAADGRRAEPVDPPGRGRCGSGPGNGDPSRDLFQSEGRLPGRQHQHRSQFRLSRNEPLPDDRHGWQVGFGPGGGLRRRGKRPAHAPQGALRIGGPGAKPLLCLPGGPRAGQSEPGTLGVCRRRVSDPDCPRSRRRSGPVRAPATPRAIAPGPHAVDPGRERLPGRLATFGSNAQRARNARSPRSPVAWTFPFRRSATRQRPA